MGIPTWADTATFLPIAFATEQLAIRNKSTTATRFWCDVVILGAIIRTTGTFRDEFSTTFHASPIGLVPYPMLDPIRKLFSGMLLPSLLIRFHFGFEHGEFCFVCLVRCEIFDVGVKFMEMLILAGINVMFPSYCC